MGGELRQPVIRNAVLSDVPGIVELLVSEQQRTAYRDMPVHTKTIRENLKTMVSSATHEIWVADRGEIVGTLGVVSQPLWFSRKHYATQLFFVVNEKGKGTGPALLRRFRLWVDSRPIICDATVGLDSEAEGIERTERFMERSGLQRVGSIYRIR